MFCINAFNEFTTSKSYLCFEHDQLTSKELNGFERLLRKVFGCYANTHLSQVIENGYKNSLTASSVLWDPQLQTEWLHLVHKCALTFHYTHQIPSYQLGDKVVHLRATYSLNDIVADRDPDAQVYLESSIKANLSHGTLCAFSPTLESRIQRWIRNWADQAARANIETEIAASIVELHGEVMSHQDEMISNIKRHLENWHNTPTIRKINFIMLELRAEGGSAPVNRMLVFKKRAGKLTIEPYETSPSSPFVHEPKSLTEMDSGFTSERTTLTNHIAAKIVRDSAGIGEMHSSVHDYEAIVRRMERARAADPEKYREIDEQQAAFDRLPPLEGRRLLDAYYDAYSRGEDAGPCPRPAQIARAPNYGYDNLPAELQARQQEHMRTLAWEVDPSSRNRIDEAHERIPYRLDQHAASQVYPAESTLLHPQLSLAFAFPLLDDVLAHAEPQPAAEQI